MMKCIIISLLAMLRETQTKKPSKNAINSIVVNLVQCAKKFKAYCFHNSESSKHINIMSGKLRNRRP